ncbi:MAG: polysaccharide deacetylase family protein [Lachnospiraceae bacterium]|nr:polysaccharide deacetylase family protein [Lachnospiraceae bacterium]
MNEDITAKICPVRYGRKAICTIISDDGRMQTAENLSRLAAEFDCKVTVAQAVRYVQNITRWRELEQHGKLEFISHSYNHRRLDDDNLSDKELEHEITEARQFMEDNFRTDQIAFVPPNNQLSDRAYSVCENQFYAIRRWKRLYNFLSPEQGRDWLQWLNLGCKGIHDVETTAERNHWIDDVVLQEKWLIEMWHDVELEKTERYQCTTLEEAKQHLTYIRECACRNFLWVAPFTEAVKYIKEVQSCRLEVSKINRGEWKIFLDKGIAKKDDRFDMPLTLKIVVPEGVKQIYTISEGKKFKLERQNDTSIQLELNPGGVFELLIDT